jgi:uncharacterized protein YbaP (TraB family)
MFIAPRLRALAAALLLLGAFVSPAAAGPCGGRDLLDGAGGAALAGRVAAAAETVNADATFWRVEATDGSLPPSWLLGTIHLTDSRVTTLPAGVSMALASARVLAVENRAALKTDRDPVALQHFLSLAVYRDGRSLPLFLNSVEVQALTTALTARGLPAWVFLSWKPWAVVVTALTYPPCEMRQLVAGVKFLDAVLLERAEAAGKAVVDLEDFATQLGSIAAVPEDLQVSLLKASLQLEPLQEDLHETMVRLYAAGRIGDLIGLSKALMAERLPATDVTPFWRALLDTRNAAMVESATRLARDGNAFIAAGAGHLIGETGLVAGLRRAGFRVEAVR